MKYLYNKLLKDLNTFNQSINLDWPQKYRIITHFTYLY